MHLEFVQLYASNCMLLDMHAMCMYVPPHNFCRTYLVLSDLSGRFFCHLCRTHLAADTSGYAGHTCVYLYQSTECLCEKKPYCNLVQWCLRVGLVQATDVKESRGSKLEWSAVSAPKALHGPLIMKLQHHWSCSREWWMNSDMNHLRNEICLVPVSWIVMHR